MQLLPKRANSPKRNWFRILRSNIFIHFQMFRKFLTLRTECDTMSSLLYVTQKRAVIKFNPLRRELCLMLPYQPIFRMSTSFWLFLPPKFETQNYGTETKHFTSAYWRLYVHHAAIFMMLTLYTDWVSTKRKYLNQIISSSFGDWTQKSSKPPYSSMVLPVSCLEFHSLWYTFKLFM